MHKMGAQTSQDNSPVAAGLVHVRNFQIQSRRPKACDFHYSGDGGL
jgi:hypothetical protein